MTDSHTPHQANAEGSAHLEEGVVVLLVAGSDKSAMELAVESDK